MKKIYPALFIGAFVFIISLLFVFLNPLQVVQWKISDLFFRGRKISDLIRIIAIDDASLSPEAKLGRFKDWPRSYYSQLIRTLDPHKPSAIAFDLDFREHSRGMSDLRVKQLLREYERLNATPSGAGQRVSFDWYGLVKRFEPEEKKELTHPDDVDFQKAIDESKSPVVLTNALIFSENISEFSGKFPKHLGIIESIFGGENVTIGFRNVMRDRDGILRRFMLRTSNDVLSFPMAVVKAYKKSQDIDFNNKQILINYAGSPGSFRMISFVDILGGNFKQEDIKGKILIVGATARALQDLHPTPTSRNAMPGAEIIANMVQQLLENKHLREVGKVGLIVVIFFFAFVGAFVFSHIPLRFFGIVFGAVFILYPLTAFFLYQKGLILNVVYPQFSCFFVALSSLWYRNKTEIREKKAIVSAFAHYVSPVVVNELVKNPQALKLGGTRQQITVLFSDIVGFTSFAEKLSPEDTVSLLNDYLTAMTEIIFYYNGTLDKYQGDAIMALFGAPLTDPQHAVSACAASLAMRKTLVTLHEKWNQLPQFPFKDELIQLDFRVGMATGPAVVGNVGSEKRFDYTAIGDIVNLGSRLESINRKYGTRVIVDKNTFIAITERENPFVLRKLDTVRVKGKQQATEIFELLAFRETVTEEVSAMLDDFENGRMLYTQRNFTEAQKYFDAALGRVKDDCPSQIYRNRCAFYIKKPPSQNWDAIIDLEEK